ncbi:MAG: aminoglycoside phosphotransferase family protein [Candidatus Saccharimonadales bacterium]
MNSLESASAILSRDLPDLDIASIKNIGEGWDSLVYLVNEEIVFRLPKADNALGDPARQRGNKSEIGLLKHVFNRLPVKTPEPLLVPEHYGYFGYRHIPGSSLKDYPELFKSSEQYPEILDLWVRVATVIEQIITLEDAERLGLRAFDGVNPRVKLAKVVLNSDLLDSEFTPIIGVILDKYGESYKALAKKRSVTLHGDLGFGNWLVDAHKRPYAVIDWSEATIAPPEHQMEFMWDMPPEMLRHMTNTYEDITDCKLDTEFIFVSGCTGFLGDIGALLNAGYDVSSHIEHLLQCLKSYRPEH